MKPEVKFTDTMGPVELGHSAFLMGVKDHPRGLDGTLVQTSTVQAINTFEGYIHRIETQNTIYIRDGNPQPAEAATL